VIRSYVITELADKVAALEDRVSRLEGSSGRRGSLELVEHLRETGSAGAVAYAGGTRLGEHEQMWTREHDIDDLRAADWDQAARTLDRLGSPARLALLAALLSGPRHRQELQDALGEGSTGHLYHHLRDLQAAGLVVQHRRGEHRLAPQAVVPLLAIVAAALDLAEAA
jgi:DNA-binding HxlR family transcriptional regulator